MDEKDLIKRLRNLRKKWRTEATKQGKWCNEFAERGAMTSAEKSLGIWIGYTGCSNDLDKLIKELEKGG